MPTTLQRSTFEEIVLITTILLIACFVGLLAAARSSLSSSRAEQPEDDWLLPIDLGCRRTAFAESGR
jgi:hypothetical protein